MTHWLPWQPFDFYGKTANRETVRTTYGRQISQLLHVAITHLDTGKMGFPDNLGIAILLKFLGLEGQRTVPAPGIDANHLDAFGRQKKGAFPIHTGAPDQVLLGSPGIIGTGLIGFANIGLMGEVFGGATAMRIVAVEGLLPLLIIGIGWRELWVASPSKRTSGGLR